MGLHHLAINIMANIITQTDKPVNEKPKIIAEVFRAVKPKDFPT